MAGRLTIHAWTDGACRNPGAGGYAAIIVAKEPEISDGMVAALIPYATFKPGARVATKGMVLRVVRGGEAKTTNNRMEIRAIISAIQTFDRWCALTIHTDSTYAIGVLSGTMKAKTNKDLVDEWHEASEGFKVTWEHVRGHNGLPLNEAADKLAKGEMNDQVADAS